MSPVVSLHRRCSLRHWAALALALAAIPAWSAPVGLPFDDVLRLAEERAPALAARLAQTAAAREEAARAAALPDPQLTLGLANLPITGADAFDFRTNDMTMKQIGVTQEFPSRTKRRARQDVADRIIEQTRALSEAERLAVRQAAAEAWIALWALQREAAALRTLREPASIAVRVAKARLAGGTASVTDTLAAQTAALELENRIDAAEAASEAARATLARWLGTLPADIEIAGTPPDLSVLPVDEAMLLASIDRQGPLLPWRSREAVAQAQVAEAIAGKRPDWSLGVTYGQRARTPEGLPRSDMLMIAFAVDLPLFPRNRQDRGIAAKRAELEAVAAEREDARRAQTESVRRTLAEWQGLRRRIQRQETETLPLARDRAKTALAAYAGGGDLSPWLEARRDEIELHFEHARYLRELGRAWAVLAHLLPDKENAP